MVMNKEQLSILVELTHILNSQVKTLKTYVNGFNSFDENLLPYGPTANQTIISMLDTIKCCVIQLEDLLACRRTSQNS